MSCTVRDKHVKPGEIHVIETVAPQGNTVSLRDGNNIYTAGLEFVHRP